MFTRPTHHHRALTIPHPSVEEEEEEKKTIRPFPFKLCYPTGGNQLINSEIFPCRASAAKPFTRIKSVKCSVRDVESFRQSSRPGKAQISYFQFFFVCFLWTITELWWLISTALWFVFPFPLLPWTALSALQISPHECISVSFIHSFCVCVCVYTGVTSKHLVMSRRAAVEEKKTL